MLQGYVGFPLDSNPFWGYTLEKNNPAGSPKNHPIEKEHHLPNVHYCVQKVDFQTYTPEFTNMTGWKIAIFNRIHTSSFMVDFLASHVSFLGVYL